MRFRGRTLRWILPFMLILATAAYTAAQDAQKTISQNTATLIMQAEQGDAKAQASLGLAYAVGYGVPQDSSKAVRWWRKAAEQRYAPAQFSLGEQYRVGNGVRRDDSECVRWWRRAAEQGYALAQYSLGRKYSDGDGVPKDAEAIRWYRKAAENRFALAQYNLGMEYSADEGVPKDVVDAYFWLSLAASTLGDKARTTRDKVGEDLTQAKRLEIQERCRKWVEAHPQSRD
jgi:TPR repeat protein